jgi:15-cis-phytoene synthase
MQLHSPDSAPVDRSDIARCRALLRHGSKTFFAASFLLPRWLREPASALYAFCRLADDCVDVDGGRLQAIAELRHRLDRAYHGCAATNAVDRAFAATVRAFNVPRDLPEALLAGLEWDATGRRYEDLGELNAYAARVAGTVGAMMAVLMGVRSPLLVARACDLGIAMQLTNIARDVGEDARQGRIYLPLAWMREVGIDPGTWLNDPVFSPELGSVIARLLDAADAYYARADAGIARLPASCRPGIRAARTLYAEIGHQLRRDDYDSVTTRTVVSTSRKLQLLALAAGLPGTKRGAPDAPCIAQAQFLVDSIAPEPAGYDAAGDRLCWWNLHSHAVWVIALFERLEQRDRGVYETNSSQGATAQLT